MHKDEVKTYFDALAPSYSQRFGDSSPFLAYYFAERIRIACENLQLQSSSILDVGAGTGVLFDYLTLNNIDGDAYLAIDLSAEMLKHSHIPEKQRIIGDILALTEMEASFDLIFMLGVSTYMPIEDIRQVLDFAHTHLKPNGQVIVSFTYRSGLDYRMRSWLKPVVRWFVPGSKVIQQQFPITAINPDEVEALSSSRMQMATYKWLPAVAPGLHHLFPKLAVAISKKLTRFTSAQSHLRWLRTDFIAFLSRN